MKYFLSRTSILVIKTAFCFSLFLLTACGAQKQAAVTSTATSSSQTQNQSAAERNGLKAKENVEGTDKAERVKLNEVK